MNIAKINLYNGDCEEAMKGMMDNQYDLAIVDPPYGIQETWRKNRRDKFYKKGKLYSYTNEEIPSEEYFRQLERVSKNRIIWGGNYMTKYLPAGNNWIVWDKKRNYKKTFMSEAELAWHSFPNPIQIIESQWNGSFKGQEKGKCNKIHPHQKPIHLYEWILTEFANPGDKILDTHGGSMSIAIACHNLGFGLDLWEIDKKYFEAGKKRLTEHIKQLQLFR